MANILSQHWLLSRRHMLRGLGVSLALPLFDCMSAAAAGCRQGGAAEAKRVHIPSQRRQHGRLRNDHGGAGLPVEPLAALEKHRKVITPISGLHHPHGLGHHHNCTTIWLTGAKIGPSERNTISVDQLMAQVTVPQLVLLVHRNE